jgi:hypothetical protein
MRSDLINDYVKFCKYRKTCVEEGLLDLSDENFLYPTTIVPLVSHINEERVSPIILPRDEAVASYLQIVTNGSRFRLSRVFNKSYIPLVGLPRTEENREEILQGIFDLHDHGEQCGGQNAFKYLIQEISDNIYQHSEFTNALVMAQKYSTMGFMDICLFDDGITINGCFKKHKIYYIDDCQAIVEAVNGVSTKEGQRGYGLNTTMRIFTQGVKGEILIVSGKGLLSYRSDNEQTELLDSESVLKGTLVSVRIPYPSPEVNIYDYLF